MNTSHYLFVYAWASDLQMIRFLNLFASHATSSKVVDLAKVAKGACALHYRFDDSMTDGIFEAGPSSPRVPVRVWGNPCRATDGTGTMVLEAGDDCADEWRDITRSFEGLHLVVTTTPVDQHGPSITHRYWAGRRTVLREHAAA